MKATSETEYKRGDTVRLDGAPERKQPFTVAVVYHTGTLRLSDPYGYPKVGVDPDDVELVGQ